MKENDETFVEIGSEQLEDNESIHRSLRNSFDN
jgi:hypothetical protein